MLKSASLFICFFLLVSVTTASIPRIDLNITSNDSVNIPQIDLTIKENIPQIDLNIKEDSKIPQNNSSIPEIDLNIKENIPQIDLNIKEDSKKNSSIPEIDLNIKENIPQIDLNIKADDLKTGETQANKIPEIDLDIKNDNSTKNAIASDEDTEDTEDDDEDVPEENKKGICDITLITPVGQLYERLVEANNKNQKLKTDDGSGILFLVVNTHTCLCKVSGTALHKENRSEKPFLKIKPTEKELMTTYKFPFPVRSASFKCTNTA